MAIGPEKSRRSCTLVYPMCAETRDAGFTLTRLGYAHGVIPDASLKSPVPDQSSSAVSSLVGGTRQGKDL